MPKKTRRPIITIDESKCDGCGQCITACAEGALQLVDGKAKLVSEACCDGLGACLGECPQGAISVEEREAASFDEEAVALHLAAQKPALPCGCPGSAARALGPAGAVPLSDGPERSPEATAAAPSLLGNWPVQLALMPINAPYLHQANLLLAADCAAFSVADFHRRFVAGKVVAIGCPKLDDAVAYQRKLAEILRRNEIASIEVVYMEVPCCRGLVRVLQTALATVGKDIPVTLTRVGIGGDVQESERIPA